MNKEIFTRESVACACERFSDLAEITITERGVYYECRFAHCRWNEKITIREFENYIIDLLNSRVAAS